MIIEIYAILALWNILSSKAGGTTNFSAVIAKFGADVSGFMSGIRSMRDASSSFAGHMGGVVSRVGGGFVGMGRSIIGAVSGVGQWLFFAKQGIQIAAGLAGSLFSQNAAMEQTTVAFKGLLGSGQAASAMMKQLQAFAAATPFEFPELAKDTQQLLGMGVAAKDIIPWMTAIGDAAAGVGAGQEGVNQITLALGQMQAKAKISGDEMMQLTEAGIPAWKILAGSMGLTVAQVQDLAQQGNLGQDAIDKLVAGIEKMYSGQMKNQATTFNGLLSTLKDEAGAALRAFVGPAFETAKGGLAALTDLLDPSKHPGIQQFATTLGQGVGVALQTIAGVIGQTVTWFQQMIAAAQKGDQAFRAFSPALGFARDIFSQIGSILQSVFTPSIQVATAHFTSIGTSIQGVIPQGVSLADVLRQISNFLAGINTGPFSQFLAQLTNTAFQVAGQYIENIRQNFAALQTIMVTAVIPAFIQMWPTISGVLAALAPLGPVLLSLVGSAFQLAGVIRGAVVIAFQTFMPMIASIVTEVGNFLIPVIQFMTPAFQSAAVQIRAFVGELEVRLGPAIKNVGITIKTLLDGVLFIWRAVWPSLIPILKGVWDIISGVVKIAWSLVSGIILVGLDILSGNWGQAWTDIKNMFAGIWDGIVSILRGVWGALSIIFSGMLTFLKGLWDRILGDTSKAWNGMWKTISDWVNSIWNTIKNKSGDILSALLKPFKDFGAGIGGVMRGAVNGIIGWLNSAIDRIDDFITSIARGINNVASALGAGRPMSEQRPIGHIPGLARGTNFFAGGPAILGEEGRELAFLPRGTAVAPHRETEALIRSGLVPSPNRGPSGIPGFAGGVGDWLGNIWNWISGGIKNIGAHVFDQIGAHLTLGGSLGNIAGGFLGKIKEWLGAWVNKLLPAMGGAGNLPQAAYGEFILPHVNAGWHVPLWYGLHQGIDLGYNQGSLMREVIGGRVLPHTGWYPWGGEVDVQLANGLWERYIHLSAIFARAGELLRRGDLVGLTGGGTFQTGYPEWSGGPHLHIQYDTGGYQASVFPLSVWKAFRLMSPFMFGSGGMITEPIAGIGLRSGAPYSFGERGPETVTPGVGRGRSRNDDEMLDLLRTIARAVTSQPISRYQLSQALGQVLTEHL
jgi:tape measure domain-containing protein